MKSPFGNILLSFVATLLTLAAVEGAARLTVWSKDNLPFLLERSIVSLLGGEKISDRTFNIYYFGGSTMQGAPYGSRLHIDTGSSV